MCVHAFFVFVSRALVLVDGSHYVFFFIAIYSSVTLLLWSKAAINVDSISLPLCLCLSQPSFFFILFVLSLSLFIPHGCRCSMRIYLSINPGVQLSNANRRLFTTLFSFVFLFCLTLLLLLLLRVFFTSILYTIVRYLSMLNGHSEWLVIDLCKININCFLLASILSFSLEFCSSSGILHQECLSFVIDYLWLVSPLVYK